MHVDLQINQLISSEVASDRCPLLKLKFSLEHKVLAKYLKTMALFLVMLQPSFCNFTKKEEPSIMPPLTVIIGLTING